MTRSRFTVDCTVVTRHSCTLHCCHTARLSDCTVVTLPCCHTAQLSDCTVVTLPCCHTALLSHGTVVTRHCRHTALLSHGTVVTLPCRHTALLSHGTVVTLHSCHTAQLSHGTVVTLYTPVDIIARLSRRIRCFTAFPDFGSFQAGFGIQRPINLYRCSALLPAIRSVPYFTRSSLIICFPRPVRQACGAEDGSLRFFRK